MNRTTPQATASRSLLDVITSLRDEEQPSELLIAALGGKAGEGMAMMDEQFKLLDLASTELAKEGETALEEEQELLKLLPKPTIKPRAYSYRCFDKEKIKLGAAIQHEQQRLKAEGLLQQDVEEKLMQEEVEDKAQK